MSEKRRKKSYVNNLSTVAMSTSIIVVSSWLSVPFAVNFTLQLLAIFIISDIFDIKKSFLSVALYISLGFCGLPVFSGFGAGIASLIGPTGGFILGFLFVPLILHVFKIAFKPSFFISVVSMLSGLILCYIFGTVWYALIYSGDNTIGLLNALTVCVFPFIVFDIIKIFVAALISSRLKRVL